MITNPNHLVEDIHYSIDNEEQQIKIETDVAYSALYSKLQEWWVLHLEHRTEPFAIFGEWDIIGSDKIHFDK